MLYKNKNKTGFSLAELLISLMVISIVLAATIPTITDTSILDENLFEFSNDNKNIHPSNPNVNLTLGSTGSTDTLFNVGDTQIKNTLTNAERYGFAFSIDGDKLSIITKSSANSNFANAPISLYNLANGALTTNDMQYAGRIAADANNLAFGIGSLSAQELTTKNNAAIGHYSLLKNTKGQNNIALGNYAMLENTEGNNNIAVGRSALTKNSTGSKNIAIGDNSLSKNSTNSYNIAVGNSAISKAVEGDDNVAVGNSALENSTKADGNVAIGSHVLSQTTTSTMNTAIGHSALKFNSSGTSNTTMGYASMSQANKAEYSVAIGAQSMRFLKDGFANVAIGYYALNGNLNENSSFDENTAIGYSNLSKNETGNNNSALGSFALGNNKSGSNNVAVGKNALNGNISGNNNIAIGYEAGKSEAGSNMLYIGTGDAPIIKGDMSAKTLALNAVTTATSLSASSVSATTVSATTVTANSANIPSLTAATTTAKNLTVSGTLSAGVYKVDNLYTNTIYPKSGGYVLNGSGTTILKVNTDASGMYYDGKKVTTSILSDARLKNIKGDSKVGLKEINALQIKDYTYKADKKKTPRFGVIAQELKKIFPNSVTKGDNGYYQITTEDITFALVNAVKELFAKIQDLTAKVTGLDKRLNALEEQNKLLKQQNEALDARLKKLEAKAN